MRWIDQEYQRRIPNPPHVVTLARDWLAKWDHGLTEAAFPDLAVSHTLELMGGLTVLIDGVAAEARLPLELRFNDPDEELVIDGMTVRSLIWQQLIALRVRLHRLLPTDDQQTPPPAVPAATILQFTRDSDCDDDDALARELDDVVGPIDDYLPRFPPPNYYATAHWKRVSADCRRAYGYTCALNVTHRGSVEVHHRTYARLWNELPTDVFPLCEECHQRFHRVLLQPLPLLAAIQKAA